MAYVPIPEESSSLGYFGCGPGCTCAPCRAQSAQLGQWYVPEEETGPAPAPQPREPGRTAGWGSYSLGAPFGWRLGSYLGQPPAGPGTQGVPQAPSGGPIKCANVPGLRLVNFGHGKYTLEPQHKADLARMVPRLRSDAPGITNGTHVLSIEGHIDSSEGQIKVFGMGGDLSLSRAQQVERFLKDSRVTLPTRLTGMGAAQPIGDNRTEAGRQQNRRVEIRMCALGVPHAAGGSSPAMHAVTDTTQVPFRWVCRIEAITQTQTETGHSFGTGVLISPWHALTCAHVIYPLQARELYRTVRVVVSPGYSATSKPAFEANGWAVSERWNPRECVTSIYFDYGIIRLAKPVGSTTGHWRNWLPLSQAPSLPGMSCKLVGYPTTQMFQSDGHLGPSVKITLCRPEERSPSGVIVRSYTEGVTAPVNPYSILITHDADSTESMSGGPVWVDNGASPRLVAIHAGPMAGRKRAVLLSQAVQYDIHQWMNGSLRPLA